MRSRKLLAAGMTAALTVGLLGAAPAQGAGEFTTTLTGQVTLAGQPVDGAKVVLSEKKDGYGYESRTDETGAYSFAAVPLAADGTGVAWSLRVEVDQDDNPVPALTTYNGDTSRKQDAKKFVVPPGGSTMDVALVESATVRGKVVDADGRPVAGAGVWVDHDTRFGRGYGETDAQGTFVVYGLDSGPVSVVADKGRLRGTGTATLERGRTTTVRDVVLHRVPKDGKFRAKIKQLKKFDPVYLFDTKTKRATIVWGTKRAKGSFTLTRPVAPGTYRLVIGRTNVTSKKFTVEEGKTTKVGKLKAAKKRTRVHGTVKRPNGKPLANASVEVYDSFGIFVGSDRTNAKGKYSVKGVLKGTYRVTVNGLYRAAKITAPAKQVKVKKGKDAKRNVKLQRTFTVTGRVTDGSGPVNAIRVSRLVPNQTGCITGPDSASSPLINTCVDEPYEWLETVKTDKDGRFTLRHVPRGEQTFMVWDSTLGGYETKLVTVKVKKGRVLNIAVTR